MKNCLAEKRMENDVRGSVTPMVCIIIAAVIFLNYVMLDALRIKAVERVYAEKNELAAYSLLSLYDNILENNYGIYVLTEDMKTTLENRYYEIMSDNPGIFEQILMNLSNKDDYVSLGIMPDDIISAKVELGESLESREVLKKEIASLMKYKTPANMAVSAVDVISDLTGCAAQADGLSEYGELSRLCDKYTAKRNELNAIVNGVSDELPDGINGFFMSVFAKPDSELISKITSVKLPDETVYSETAAEVLKNALNMYAVGCKAYADYCDEAIVCIGELIEIQTKVSETIAKTKKLEKDEYVSSGLAMMVKESETKILTEDFRPLTGKISANAARLKAGTNAYNDFALNFNAGEKIDLKLFGGAMDAIQDAYDKYEKIPLKGAVISEAGPSESAIETVLDEILPDIDLKIGAGNFFDDSRTIIPDAVYSNLPSVKNPQSFGSKISDLLHFDSVKDVKDFALGNMNFTELIKKQFNDTADSFYIDDYVGTYFKDASEVKNPATHFISAETEYIIAGKSSDRKNLSTVYTEILILRILLNVVHILSDEEKNNAVKSLADSLAAATTMGMGAPIFEIVFTLVWAAAESLVDMERLDKGDAIPLIKSDDDWKTSLDSVMNNTFSEEEVDDKEAKKGLYYSDYLKILLIEVPRETKLARIQDLLELNRYKQTAHYMEVGEMYTSVTVTSKVKTKTFAVTDESKNYRHVTEMENNAAYG